jgi:predicted Zn-dependent protease
MDTAKRLALLSLLISPLLVGCSKNPVTGKSEFIMISREEEIALGEEAGPKFEAEFGGKVPHAGLQSYIRGVGAKIAAVSDRPMPYEFTLLASDIPNAFALPGGKLYVTAGLMSRMQNERELAAVLGHEVTHVAARHNVKGLQRQIGAAVLVELAGIMVGADKEAAAEAAAKIVAGMVNLNYSRDHEYEADKYGIQYMSKAGYNPYGMVELLETLFALHDSEPGSFGEMFQTHPLTSKRINTAKDVIRNDARLSRYSATAPDPNARRFLQMRALLPTYIRKSK